MRSSTVSAWELGVRLAEHRGRLGWNTREAGELTGIGQTNLSAIETGKRRVTANSLAGLVRHYELADEEATELDALRLEADQREWWYDYGHIYDGDVLRFIGLEAGAGCVREYSSEVVPGLLQTPEYARAIIQAGSPYIRPVDVEPRVESRLVRQERLDDQPPLLFEVAIGEAALRLQIGGPEVMGAQLRHLLEIGEREAEHVRIRVVPFAVGAHPLIGVSVQILSFASQRLPDLVWQETAIGSRVIDNRQARVEFTASFEGTFKNALDEADSRRVIEEINKEME